MYPLMANCANKNTQIKDLLFEVILDKKKQKEVVMDIIKDAWLPALFLLEEGSCVLKKRSLKIPLKNGHLMKKKYF
jgi:hypothetical protein